MKRQIHKRIRRQKDKKIKMSRKIKILKDKNKKI